MKITYYDNRLMTDKVEQGLTRSEYNSRMGDLNAMAAGGHVSNIIGSKEEIDEAAAAMGHKGGSVKSDAKAASSRENGRKGGAPAKDAFNEMFPVAQNFHTGLWGWRRVNGCVDLNKCTFKSRSAATRDRNNSNEKALWMKTGEVCISK